MFNKIMVEEVKESIYVDSWRPTIHSTCDLIDSYNVWNVEHISYSGDDDETWKYTHDHSKWIVSKAGDIVCNGDMNHSTS